MYRLLNTHTISKTAQAVAPKYLANLGDRVVERFAWQRDTLSCLALFGANTLHDGMAVSKENSCQKYLQVSSCSLRRMYLRIVFSIKLCS